MIERFDRNRDAYLRGQYNEAMVRGEYIDPFFIALGWDVHNTAGYAEAYPGAPGEAPRRHHFPRPWRPALLRKASR